MKKVILFLSISLVFSSISMAQPKVPANTKTGKPAAGKTLPYVIAQNFFVKNTFQQGMLKNPKITSQMQFEEIFGAGAFMGENGKPTMVDFSKQYVIAVIPATTQNSVTLSAVSLKQSGKTIIFTYAYKEGAKQTFTSQPSLIIVVDKKYTGEVKTVKS
jgi:hypothetical protein